MEHYIRFDWAMKRLLRDKANHAVLEGLVTSLLGRKYTIVRFLESEGNQDDMDDKFNRVDMLAESDKGELTIIEIQNCHELTYFHRMLYGVSKAITEYINLGDDYDKVRKVYSINIVYFELGQGGDYVYHGKTEFRGLHNTNDILKLSVTQSKKFFGIEKNEYDKLVQREAGDLFPEYYVLRINDFDNISKTPIDEWMEFLKTGNIEKNVSAPGLKEAREKLRIDSLTIEERRSYERHMEALRFQRSVIGTSREEGLAEGHAEGYEKGIKDGMQEGIKEGIKEGLQKGIKEGLQKGLQEGLQKGIEEGKKKASINIAKKMLSMHMPIEQIAELSGLSANEVAELSK